VSVFTATDTVFQIGANTTANDRVNMQGTALKSTMSLGTQTITDRNTNTAGQDIASAISTASAVATAAGNTTDITSLQNAAIDAINSSQKLSFTAKNDALDTIQTLANLYNGSGTTGTGGTTLNLVGGLTNKVNSFAADLTTVLSNSTGSADLTGIKATSTTAQNPFQSDAGGLATKLVSSAVTTGVFTFVLTGGSNATTAGNIGATQTAASGQSLAQAAINAVDSALTEVNTASAVQGALQNRFTAVISNLSAFSQSQTAAKSRIVDADFAAETARLSKNQILNQAGTAMLAQANQLPSSVLSLLK
jgi:flagellin